MCIVIAWFLPHSFRAKMQNQLCGNCHIMHNSQGGEIVTDDAQRHFLTLFDTSLDKTSCHTGRIDGTSTTPCLSIVLARWLKSASYFKGSQYVTAIGLVSGRVYGL